MSCIYIYIVYLPVREKSFRPTEERKGSKARNVLWHFKYKEKQLPQETSQEFKNQLFSMSFSSNSN